MHSGGPPGLYSIVRGPLKLIHKIESALVPPTPILLSEYIAIQTARMLDRTPHFHKIQEVNIGETPGKDQQNCFWQKSQKYFLADL